MTQEFSYGIVPLRKQGDVWMVLLIQHGSARYWGFPKGHAEQSEQPQQAAIRVLKEVTNMDIVRFLADTMFEEHYHFTLHGKHVDKTVGYFPAIVSGDLVLQEAEISDSQWLSVEDALNQLTYATDKAVLDKVEKLISHK